ncbi:54S ribosomal protein L49, mitochondrial precursor [Phaeosphaeriaceae sp. PMI808]|nr:54S ribosomal protein L49, mitochondrial precursor [Phaeosphaeriaceae sp. PMI808]
MALLARAARRSLLESRSSLPPTFLLPFRAQITTASHTLETGNIPDPLIRSGQHISQDLRDKVLSKPQLPPKTPAPESKPSPHARKNIVSTHITPTIRSLLPILHTQSSHYITIHIHGRPYLLTKGDTLRLPFQMPHVRSGDVLRLNRATHIGSRDYTLKAPEPLKGNADHVKKVFYLDDRMFVCRARVVGEESEPMRVEEKTKRRQRHVKHVRSKMRFTVLRISELEVKSLEEYEAALKG